MALPINIEDLLGSLVVEGNRVEYKKGWNPDPIYRTICAFANDFDDTCGGYIVVGVDEVDGRAVRPVVGININEIEPIEKAMVGFNNLIAPYYQPRVFYRRYDEYQPVEVNIMPDMIEIISYGGAERSIKLDDLRAGKRVHARRYRNPRLGEFLKELHLTEGRGTGFPTIHEELRKNGSPDSIIEADDDHTYVIIRIPCHPEFVCEELSMDKDGHILPVGEVWQPDVPDNVPDVTDNVLDNVPDVIDNVTDKSTAEKRRDEILHLMRLDKKITYDNLANILHVSRKTVQRDIDFLRSQNKLMREGEDHGGTWVVL